MVKTWDHSTSLRKFNSPIFTMAKMDGSIWLVHDFGALNANTHTDRYFMKDVSEFIDDIG